MTRLMEHGFTARERNGSEHHCRLIGQIPLQVLDLLGTGLADRLHRLADMPGRSALPASHRCPDGPGSSVGSRQLFPGYILATI
jgi:hypothetical protein